MKQLLIAALAGTALSSQAFALETLKCSQRDARVCSVPYRADDMVEIDADVGATVAVQLSDSEVLGPGSIAASDRSSLKVAPDGSVLFLKARVAMPLQPLFLKTILKDGSTRVYALEFQAIDSSVKASGLSDAADVAEGPKPVRPLLIRFTYPDDVAAARRAAWRKAAAARAARAAEDALATAPPVAVENDRFVGQGDQSLVPSKVWDDGQSTFLTFPGSVRVPAIFAIAPDGKEAQTDYSVSGRTITIRQTAREFRLRDGDTVLNIWNQGWNPIGTNPGTGTTSPDVTRVVKVSSDER